jgi:hypothetical protein
MSDVATVVASTASSLSTTTQFQFKAQHSTVPTCMSDATNVAASAATVTKQLQHPTGTAYSKQHANTNFTCMSDEPLLLPS